MPFLHTLLCSAFLKPDNYHCCQQSCCCRWRCRHSHPTLLPPQAYDPPPAAWVEFTLSARTQQFFLPFLTPSCRHTSKHQNPITLPIFLPTKPHLPLKRNTHTHTRRTQVPKFLQKALTSVCFAFQYGTHALCGTRRHFPTKNTCTLKPEAPWSLPFS